MRRVTVYVQLGGVSLDYDPEKTTPKKVAEDHASKVREALLAADMWTVEVQEPTFTTSAEV